jgi:hypothetical protein
MAGVVAMRLRALSQKEDEDMKSLFRIYIYAAIPKIWWMKEIGPVTSSLSKSSICPLRIIAIASYPLRGRRAV